MGNAASILMPSSKKTSMNNISTYDYSTDQTFKVCAGLKHNTKFHDAVFVGSDGGKVDFNRAAVASAAEHFETSLYGTFSEGCQSNVKLDAKTETIRFAVGYLLTGALDLEQLSMKKQRRDDGTKIDASAALRVRRAQLLLELYAFGHIYCIAGLMSVTSSRLQDYNCVEEAYLIFNFFKESALEDVRFIVANSVQNIAKNIGRFKPALHPLLSLGKVAVKEIFKRNDLHATELSLLRLVDEWGVANHDTEYAKELVECIDLRRIRGTLLKEFVGGIVNPRDYVSVLEMHATQDFGGPNYNELFEEMRGWAPILYNRNPVAIKVVVTGTDNPVLEEMISGVYKNSNVKGKCRFLKFGTYYNDFGAAEECTYEISRHTVRKMFEEPTEEWRIHVPDAEISLNSSEIITFYYVDIAEEDMADKAPKETDKWNLGGHGEAGAKIDLKYKFFGEVEEDY